MKNSIIVKLSGSIGAIVTVVLLVLGFLNYRSIRADRVREIRSKANDAVARLAANLPKAIWDTDKHFFDTLLNSEMDESVISAIIVELVRENDTLGRWRDPEDGVLLEGLQDIASYYSLDRELVWGEEAHHLGTVTVHMNDKLMQAALGAKIREIAFQVVILNVAVAALLIVILRSQLLMPLKDVVQAAHSIARGDLSYRVKISQDDEIGQLADAFREMTEALKLKANAADQIASGNLQIDVVVSSEEDVLGKSMLIMKLTLQTLKARLSQTIEAQKEGDLDARCDPATLKGGYAELLVNMNEALDAVIQPILNAMTIMEEYAREQLDREMPVLPGKQIIITNGLNRLREEIAERKRAQEELVRAQKEVVEKAHKAGMAEVATGVLHNVGNILTSVITASQLLQDRLKSPNIENLKRANALLREHEDNLSDFILNDKRGEKLLLYYLKLEDALDGEHKFMTQSLCRIEDRVQEISKVIAAQQDYANNRFMTERGSLKEIVEEALALLSASTSEENDICTSLDEDAIVVTQKTKLLQVLINLFKNSREAVAAAKYSKPKITVEISRDDSTAYVKISDNGCGIDSEIQGKIFNHGFTTKTKGHGFGLHSCANFMTEMNGKIWVESDGLEKGADFFLSLPVAPEQQTLTISASTHEDVFKAL